MLKFDSVYVGKTTRIKKTEAISFKHSINNLSQQTLVFVVRMSVYYLSSVIYPLRSICTIGKKDG